MKTKIITTICSLLFLFTSTTYAAESEPPIVSIPEIVASSAIVIDADTGIIIYEKNKDEKNYPASITKIMTALLSLEKAPNLTDRILFSKEAVFSLPFGSSNIAMDADETLTYDQALYGLMLASANEVANALGESISGTTEDFGKLMTQRAHDLGATHTNFVNPHGLHDENHYTTAYDIALIMREAVKNPDFIRYISTKSYQISPTEKQPESRPLNNTNKMIFPTNQYYNEYVIGGKTGFTDEAQHTLVTYSQKEDMKVIVAILNDEKSKPYTDTIALLDYAFSQYDDVKIFDSRDYSGMIPVYQSMGIDNEKKQIGSVNLQATTNVTQWLPKTAVKQITTKANIPDQLTAPVNAGQHIGELEIRCGTDVLATVRLTAANNVVPIAVATPSPEPEKEPLISPDKQFSTVEISLWAMLGILVVASILIGILKIRQPKKYSLKFNLRNENSKPYRFKKIL